MTLKWDGLIRMGDAVTDEYKTYATLSARTLVLKRSELSN